MSEITEIKTSLKTITSILEEINRLKENSLPKLKQHPSKLLELVEKFESEKDNNLNTIEANSDEINSLKNKISQNKRDISKLEEENNDLTKKRQELGDKIKKIQNELTETQEKISAKKGELENRESRLKDLEENIQELTTTQKEIEEKIKELEIQLRADFDKKDKIVRSFENRVKAMRLLINKDYIRSPQVQIIQALQKDTALDVNNMVQALDIKLGRAQSILRKIVELNGPIDYDEVADKVTLKAEVDF